MSDLIVIRLHPAKLIMGSAFAGYLTGQKDYRLAIFRRNSQ